MQLALILISLVILLSPAFVVILFLKQSKLKKRIRELESRTQETSTGESFHGDASSELKLTEVDNIQAKAPSVQTESVALDVSSLDSQPPALNSSAPDPSVKNSDITLNIVLFVASLLIIGGVAAFVASAKDAVFSIVAIWMSILMFYGGGMALYRLSDSLRPAAIAFLSIAMALVPFSGVALNKILGVSGSHAWLATSVAALFLYGAATLFLKSQVATYVSIGSLVSLALAIGNNIADGFVWLLIPLVLIGIVSQLAVTLLSRRLPSYSAKPLTDASIYLGVIAALFSLVLFESLSYLETELVLGLALLQYTLYYWQTRRYMFAIIVRVLLSAIIITIGFHIADSYRDYSQIISGSGIVLAALVQQVISLYIWSWAQKVRHNRISEVIFLSAALIVEWLVVINWWGLREHFASGVLLAIITIISMIYSLRLKHFGWMYAALVSLVILPVIIVGYDWLYSIRLMQVLSWYYLGASLLFASGHLMVRRTSPALAWSATAMMIHVVIAFLFSVGSFSVVVTLAIFLITAYLYLMSYTILKPGLVYLASMSLVFAVGRLLYLINNDTMDIWIYVTSWLFAGAITSITAEIIRLNPHTTLRYESVFRRSAAIIWFIGYLVGSMVYAGSKYHTRPGSILVPFTSLLLSGLFALQYTRSKRLSYGEVSLYAMTATTLSLVSILDRGSIVEGWVYIHIIVAAIASAGLIYSGRRRSFRFKFAIGLMTFHMALTALSGGVSHQLIFLVEQLAVLVAGSVFNKRWAVWWGAIAAIFALMYILKDVQYAVLILAGLGLIAYVVQRLARSNAR
ncbi:hypothetical protein GX865_02960 [Candidatus Saccharibacteria bacterium]|jgi:hypothetical protein|nr:hypothetical protein [Candidatus Saccharibacteria bacterium]